MAAKLKGRKFFLVEPSFISHPQSFVIKNEEKLLSCAGLPRPRSFSQQTHRPGFWSIDQHVEIAIGRGCKFLTRDLDVMRGFWIVSEKFKQTLSSIDVSGVEFLECNCYDTSGSLLGNRWLCEVTRVLDALDEEKSDVVIVRGSGGEKRYSRGAYDNMYFRDEIVSDENHLFNMNKFSVGIIADEVFRNMCRENRLKNIRFMDTENLIKDSRVR